MGVLTGEHIAQAYATIRKAGTLVLTAVGNLMDVGLPIPVGDLVLTQKRIQGALYGGCGPSTHIPQQLDLYRAGKLKLDELITTQYSLDEIAQGYADMHAGRNIRGVLVF